jgi:mRNA-degrading endonuclease toxin of MazEF toxin-antitoxin module
MSKKSRPKVIVPRDYVNNQGDKNVVGVPFSTRLHKANSHRILIPAIHMIRDAACTRQLTDSVALTDHIRVLDPNRFDLPKPARLSDTAMGASELGLDFLFDIR